jgi:hypothetical protein
VFVRTPENYARHETWYDLGTEYMLVNNHSQALTLLWKKSCTKQWVDWFKCPSNGGLVQERQYNWGGCYEAAAVDVALQETNTLAKMISYNKHYSVEYSLFSTPLKNHRPFDNELLPLLAYAQDVLDQYWRVNRRSNQQHYNRESIRQIFCDIKARIKHMLANPLVAAQNFGVRQEMRSVESVVEAFAAREPNQAGPCLLLLGDNQTIRIDGEVLEGAHLPFWILPTTALLKFYKASINRWLFIFEALATRADPRPGTNQIMATTMVQLNNAVTMQAIAEILKIALNSSDVVKNNSLYKTTWFSRTRQQEASDEDEAATRVEYHGLGLREVLEEQGYIALKADMIEWDTLAFHRRHRKRLKFVTIAQHIRVPHAELQQKTLSWHKINSRIEETLFTMARTPAQAEPDTQAVNEDHIQAAIKAMYIAITDIVYISFIGWLMDIIAERWSMATTGKKNRHAKAEFMARVPATLLDGQMCLDYNIVKRLIGCIPNVIDTRPYGTRHGQAAFDKVDQRKWQDKTFAVFDWTDNSMAWSNTNFRRIAADYASMVERIIGNTAQFQSTFTKRMAAKLFIIPQYDKDKLSIMSKVAKMKISNPTELQTMAWIVPTVDCYYNGWNLRELCEAVAAGPSNYNPSRHTRTYEESRRFCTQILTLSGLQVRTQENAARARPGEYYFPSLERFTILHEIHELTEIRESLEDSSDDADGDAPYQDLDI